MRKIILVISVFLLVFLIYYFNTNKNTYYLSIGDNFINKYNIKINKYIDYPMVDDYRVTDLINDINYNKKVKYNNKEYNVQNLLIKANLITISVGINDLIYKKNIDYNYVDSLLNDIEKLLILIRKYNKDKIYFLGYDNIIDDYKLIEYANNRLKKICEKNKIYYINPSNK